MPDMPHGPKVWMNAGIAEMWVEDGYLYTRVPIAEAQYLVNAQDRPGPTLARRLGTIPVGEHLVAELLSVPHETPSQLELAELEGMLTVPLDRVVNTGPVKLRMTFAPADE